MIILRSEDKIRDTDQLDQLIKAQLPDLNDSKQKKLYKLVTNHMLHGPCGINNEKAPCMENNKCTKKFPKDFSEETLIYDNGYPLYSRPDNGIHFKKASNGTYLIVNFFSIIIQINFKNFKTKINLDRQQMGCPILSVFNFKIQCSYQFRIMLKC